MKRVEGAGVDILEAHQASRATQLVDQEDFPVVGDVAGEDVDLIVQLRRQLGSKVLGSQTSIKRSAKTRLRRGLITRPGWRRLPPLALKGGVAPVDDKAAVGAHGFRWRG